MEIIFHAITRWWFQIFYMFTPILGEMESNLTIIFFRWMGGSTTLDKHQRWCGGMFLEGSFAGESAGAPFCKIIFFSGMSWAQTPTIIHTSIGGGSPCAKRTSNLNISHPWRITPLSKWLGYKPFTPRLTLLRGVTSPKVLHVSPLSDTFPSSFHLLFPGDHDR